jgi:hypothetical protein
MVWIERIIMCWGLACLLLVCGCKTASTETPAAPAPKTIPLAVSVPQIAEPVQRSIVAIDDAKKIIDGLTTENLIKSKIEAGMHLTAAKSAGLDALTKIGVARESVEADAKEDAKRDKKNDALEKENSELKAADPAKAWLQRIGVLLMIAAIAGWVGSFWPQAIMFKGLRPLFSAIGAMGIAAVTIARFLRTIETICFGFGLTAAAIALAWLAWYVWKNHKQVNQWVAEEVAEKLTPTTEQPK